MQHQMDKYPAMFNRDSEEFAERAGKNYEERQATDKAMNKFSRMHQFAYGVKKAGMNDINDDKMAVLMHNTNQQNAKYFTKQEKKMTNQDEKIEKFKTKIAQFKSNPSLWSSTEKEV